MQSKKIVVTLVLMLVGQSAFASVLTKEEGEKIVYVDGVYDLAHYGHAKSFAKARSHAAKHFGISESKIKLLVGICDGNLKEYKREPIFSLEQRTAQIQSFKGVDGVIAGVPVVINDHILDEQNIDLVMHGDDFTVEKMREQYEPAMKRGIFATFPYEPGISTTAIIKRTTTLRLEEILEKKVLSSEDKKALQRALELL